MYTLGADQTFIKGRCTPYGADQTFNKGIFIILNLKHILLISVLWLFMDFKIFYFLFIRSCFVWVCFQVGYQVCRVKGAGGVISRDPPGKDFNFRFTTDLCYNYLDNSVMKDIIIFLPQLKIINFRNYKHWYLIYSWSDIKAITCSVVNRELLSLRRSHMHICWQSLKA